MAQPDDERLQLEREKLKLEKEKAAHARWWQEDALVNQRLTWLLQSQVILFAGYGYLIRERNPSSSLPASPEASALAKALPWIGIAVGILIALGIRAAWLAQKKLAKDYGVTGITVGVSNVTTRAGRIPAGFLPFVFIGSWGWLLKSRDGMLACLVSSFVLIRIVEIVLETWDFGVKAFGNWGGSHMEMERFVAERPGRPKRLIFNLFYPAVLGTFFVSLLPSVLESFHRGIDLAAGFDWKLLTALLIVAHFVVDYVFTEEVRLYEAGMFALDLLVIILLYIAYSSVHLDDGGEFRVRTIALSMSGVYFSFLAWEYLERKEIGKQPVMTAYEVFFAIWFLIVGFLWQSSVVLGLSLLVATIMMIIICGNVLRGYHTKLRRLSGVGS